MSSGLAVGFIIVLAVVAANAPFLTDRAFGFVRMRGRAAKPFAFYLLEWLCAYLLVGVVGLAFEQRLGRVAPQGWEFYAITICLFASFAFPGFVYRFLVLRNAPAPAPTPDGN